MTKSELFFFNNAGFSYDPKTETQEQGNLRCAMELAKAESYATEHGFNYEWEVDRDGCTGCDCGSEGCACCTGSEHETLCCVLRDDTGTVLASLGGVCSPTALYRRVVAAELALEAMMELEKDASPSVIAASNLSHEALVEAAKNAMDLNKEDSEVTT